MQSRLERADALCHQGGPQGTGKQRNLVRQLIGVTTTVCFVVGALHTSPGWHYIAHVRSLQQPEGGTERTLHPVAAALPAWRTTRPIQFFRFPGSAGVLLKETYRLDVPVRLTTYRGLDVHPSATPDFRLPEDQGYACIPSRPTPRYAGFEKLMARTAIPPPALRHALIV